MQQNKPVSTELRLAPLFFSIDNIETAGIIICALTEVTPILQVLCQINSRLVHFKFEKPEDPFVIDIPESEGWVNIFST